MDRGSNAIPEREAAAGWHDRLHHDKVSDETRRAFADWLALSPRHRELYEAIDQTWSKLQEAAEDPQILALRHETALRLTRRASQTMRPLRWAAAAMLLAMGAVVTTIALRPASDHSLIAGLLSSFRLGSSGLYQTTTGERLAFALPDGSQVTLDTQSELKVSFSPAERDVRLTRGQAFFEVAKDPRKPFVVEAHNRRLVALGTAFDVRLDGDQVKVTMVEGTVRVERRDEVPTAADGSIRHDTSAKSPDGADIRGAAERKRTVVATITAGEQLVTGEQHEDHVRPTDPERDTSWRRGQVVFDGTRLADAIAELNRYSEAKIELSDPDLADLRLSGAFATGRPTVFVEAITAYFPVQVVQSDDRVVMLSKKK